MTFKYRYLNAVMCGTPHMYWHRVRKPPHAPERDAYVLYDQVLASYAFWKPYGHPRSRYVFGDSGGYSVVTRGTIIDPERLLRWQLKGCNDGVILDLPPYVATDSAQFGGSASTLFEECLGRTVEGVRRAHPIYREALERDTPFRWWGVLQGESRTQLTQWYDGVQSVYPFEAEGEGWALAPKPSTDLLAITRHMAFARDHGIKRVHLLQVGGIKSVALLFALGLHGGFEYVSFDAATPTRLAVAKRLVLLAEDGLSFRPLNGVQEPAELFARMRACGCKACTLMREDRVEPTDEFGHYLLLHNDLALRSVYRTLYVEATMSTAGTLLDMLRRLAPRETGRILREWGGDHRQPTARRHTSLFERIQ